MNTPPTIQTVVLSETTDIKLIRLKFVPQGAIDLCNPQFYKDLEAAFLTATTEVVGNKPFRTFSEYNYPAASQMERIIIIGDSISIV